MRMSVSRTTRWLSATAALAAAVGGLSIAAAPAGAASTSAELQVKGPSGSSFTSGDMVSQVGKEGTALTFTVQVKNTGTDLAQYRVNVQGYGVQPTVYDGSLALTPLTNSDGFYTKPLAAGKTQVLTVKFTIPVGDPAYSNDVAVYLYSTNYYYIDQATLRGEEAAAAGGVSAADMFVKAGSQLAVGGTRDNQIATHTTVSPTTTATYTVTLQNNGTYPNSIVFQLYDYGCGYTTVVKDGTVVVTAAAMAGTYQTPVLAKAAKRTLTVTVKPTATACAGVQTYLYARAADYSSSHVAYLRTNKAA